MKKKKICIISQSHLCRNPRAMKEISALSATDYDIHVVTSVYSPALLREDLEALTITGATLHLIADLGKAGIKSLWDRLLHKAGRLLARYRIRETPLALGHGYRRYLAKCRSLAADLYICHQELPAVVGTVLMREGFKVAFDLEDWYSEDLLPEARKERPHGLLVKAEQAALHYGAYVSTTSAALAKALQDRYGGRLPAVIYNVFPQGYRADGIKTYRAPLQLFWFSQTIGPGRGLEGFLKLSRHFRRPVTFHFLGGVTREYQDALSSLLPAQHGLTFHPLLPEALLADKISTFDIGLALENQEPESRNLTVTNKFFHYLQAGLPVIATGTAGQQEAFGKFRPGFLLSEVPDAAELAALCAWLDDPAQLSSAAQQARHAAISYNWENQSIIFLQLVENALS